VAVGVNARGSILERRERRVRHTVVRRSLPPTTDRGHRSDALPTDTATVAENHYARPYQSSSGAVSLW
jgi:hypothetical protein